MENYSPTYNFNGTVTAANAPSGNNDLVRKQDVEDLSFISSIASGSGDFISVTNGELSVSNLLVTDVKVDTTQTSLSNYVSNTASSASLGVGDIVILTAPTANLMYIVKSNDGTATTDYEEIQSSLTAAEIAALLTGGTGINVATDGTISFNGDSDDVSEGSTNRYHTAARARSSITVSNAGGDGSLGYSQTLGVITYTGPSASETRAHFSSGDGIDITDGQVSVTADTDLISEGSNNLYHTSARARSSISVTDLGGAGSLNYNSSTGVISYSGPTPISSGDGIDITSGQISVTADTDLISEGSNNLYHTAARARSSVSGSSGIAYNSSTGAFTLDVSHFRAEFSGVSLVASTAYTLTHNLGEKFVHVSVYDSSGNKINVDVTCSSTSACTVTSVSNLSNVEIIVSL